MGTVNERPIGKSSEEEEDGASTDAIIARIAYQTGIGPPLLYASPPAVLDELLRLCTGNESSASEEELQAQEMFRKVGARVTTKKGN